ncbi:ABC transporter permease [Larkinella rosea]|uniref:FtsX-like permease family protein n=1 Tax=Larkinella rosea TaxID=2025312 RepID=A0A3P1BNN4_9BACT|nr:ABC transporter permease [Larkinella rosea]RRB02645.1 FtsX-like permease family protein [Larkinella rosea]
MLHNYFKIAWRNLLKNKLFSFINILGLSLAIPTVLMGLIQIVNYYEYDTFHEDDGRVVRLITDEKQEDGTITNWASSPVPLGNFVKENFAGIENSTTLVRDFDWVLSNGIKTKNTDAIYTDKSFFQLFKFPLEIGSYPVDPNTIVLTHETAQWFFKDSNPIGSSLEHPTYGSFKIVGVLKPFNPQRTQFRTDVMVSFNSYVKSNIKTDDWSTLNAHTFIKLAKGMTAVSLEKQLAKASAQIHSFLKTAENRSLHFKAQFLSEISPSKEALENDPFVQDIRSISLNFAFQLIIILLASLNYINLTLARSMNRSREVGVRKVAGATKSQLVLQFLTESVLISYLALGIGFFLLWFIKNQIHVSWLTWDIDHWGYLILIFFVFNLALGLVAGASPSLILSSFQPVKVLKGAISPASFGKIGFRKTLIIIQFTIALIYIFFMGHAFHQINYMANDNENYQRKHILNINLSGHRDKPLASDISAIKEIQKIGYTSLTFGNKPSYSQIKNRKSETKNQAYYYATDRYFIENMGLKIVAGTNLIASNSELPSNLIVVNQKAVEKLKLGSDQEAVGKLILLNDTLSVTIIGVVANFCHYDYEKKIEPLVFQYQPSLFKVMCLKTSPVNDRKALESVINGLWNKHNPRQEMNASWLDTDMYERYYPYEDMRFAGMEGAVIFVIAMLGLIGILTYSLEKRTKEIGIRKVIGATTLEIIKLMSNDFIKLLSIATILAIPPGIAIGVFMNSYYLYNNGIGYGTMSLLLSIVIGIALGIVGYFSWVAAQANPAKTLKTE